MCYGLTSARLYWVAIGWHRVGRKLWDTGQGLKLDLSDLSALLDLSQQITEISESKQITLE